MTSRFRFISAHRAEHGVKRLCQILAVSASGYYRWLNTGACQMVCVCDQLLS